MERLTISPQYCLKMANLFNDDMMEVEELFIDDTSSMKARHIEAAKRDYIKLKQLGYVKHPSKLRIGEYGWVDMFFLFKAAHQGDGGGGKYGNSSIAPSLWQVDLWLVRHVWYEWMVIPSKYLY